MTTDVSEIEYLSEQNGFRYNTLISETNKWKFHCRMVCDAHGVN